MTFSTELEVSGRRVAVVGGAAEALGPISRLLRLGAQVTVISLDVATSVRDLAERGQIEWLPRTATPDDYRQAALVIAATGSRHTDAEVRTAAARENRVAVPAVDEPPAATGTGSSGAERAGPRTGRVVLVGGGPGDPGLLTVAGLDAIRNADVIVTDRLAPLAALRQARADAEVIDVGKIPRGEFTPQDRINAVLVEQAQRGRLVVRLKGGDNFVFGRGGEEWQACAAAGVAVEVIPGVTSAVAAPALAGIPLTHRQLTQGFTVVSGHLPPGHPGSTLDWAALARTNTTLVIMMGVATLSAITDELLSQGMAPGTPAASVADAGMARQRSVRGTLTEIARLTAEAAITAPAITVVGAVAGFDASMETPGPDGALPEE